MTGPRGAWTRRWGPPLGAAVLALCALALVFSTPHRTQGTGPGVSATSGITFNPSLDLPAPELQPYVTAGAAVHAGMALRSAAEISTPAEQATATTEEPARLRVVPRGSSTLMERGPPETRDAGFHLRL